MIKDWDGAGKNEARTLLDKIDDPTNFRTAIHKVGDSTIMLRTKGGRPEITKVTPEKVVAAIPCVLSPLKEIAFAYAATLDVTTGVGPTGYRRWYGEPDQLTGTPTAETKYEWSSDGLLCLETRKIQKICFKDANNQTVDFLFTEKPLDVRAKGIDLPVINPTSAGAAGRYRFTEGKYAYREWYEHEPILFGWAFPSPAQAVSFFSRRLKSTYFYVTDTQNKLLPESDITASVDNPDDPGVQSGVKIKWVFTAPGVPDRSVNNGSFSACVNQNAREESFLNRQFFTPASDGGSMKWLTMRAGLIDNEAAPRSNLRLEFKTPGSFISAIDPEEAVGSERPAEVDKAIDMCELSAFGNPWHGLVSWKTRGVDLGVTFYKDASRTDTWPFSPPNTLAFGAGGVAFQHYNITGVDATIEENIVRTNDPADGELRKDATFVNGTWWVKDPEVAFWGRLEYNDVLYKDDAGTVWSIKIETSLPAWVSGESPRGFNTVITLKRRWGVLGTDFSFMSTAINRVIYSGFIDFSDIPHSVVYVDIGQVYAAMYGRVLVREDAKGAVLLVQKSVVTDRGQVNGACVIGAVSINFSGQGATDTASGASIGDGITCSFKKEISYSAGTNRTSITKEPGYYPAAMTTSHNGVTGIDSAAWVVQPQTVTDTNTEIVSFLADVWWNGLRLAKTEIATIARTHTTVAYSAIVESADLAVAPASYTQTVTAVTTKTLQVYADGILAYEKSAVKTAVNITDYSTASGSTYGSSVSFGVDNADPDYLVAALFYGPHLQPQFIAGTPYYSNQVDVAPAVAVYVDNRTISYPSTILNFPTQATGNGALIFRDKTLVVANDDLNLKTYGGQVWAASIGFAYNYHMPEITAVSFEHYAYFV